MPRVGLIFALVLALGMVGGCGRRTPSPAVTGDKLITLDEWSRMTPEAKADPYVLQNLDPAARKALDTRKTRVP